MKSFYLLNKLSPLNKTWDFNTNKIVMQKLAKYLVVAATAVLLHHDHRVSASESSVNPDLDLYHGMSTSENFWARLGKLDATSFRRRRVENWPPWRPARGAKRRRRLHHSCPRRNQALIGTRRWRSTRGALRCLYQQHDARRLVQPGHD